MVLRSWDDLLAVLAFMDRRQLSHLELCCRLMHCLIGSQFGTFPRANVRLSVWLEEHQQRPQSHHAAAEQVELMASVAIMNAHQPRNVQSVPISIPRPQTLKWQWWCYNMDADGWYYRYTTVPNESGECSKIVLLHQHVEHEQCSNWAFDATRKCYMHRAACDFVVANQQNKGEIPSPLHEQQQHKCCNAHIAPLRMRIRLANEEAIEHLLLHVCAPFVRLHTLQLFPPQALQCDELFTSSNNTSLSIVARQVRILLPQLFATIRRKQELWRECNTSAAVPPIAYFQIGVHILSALLQLNNSFAPDQQVAFLQKMLQQVGECTTVHIANCCKDRNAAGGKRTVLDLEEECCAVLFGCGRVQRLRLSVDGHSLQAVLRILYTHSVPPPLDGEHIQSHRVMTELEFNEPEYRGKFLPYVQLLLQQILKDYVQSNGSARCALSCQFKVPRQYEHSFLLLHKLLERRFDANQLMYLNYLETADGRLSYADQPNSVGYLDIVPPGNIRRLNAPNAPFLYLHNVATDEYLRIWWRYLRDGQHFELQVARYWAGHIALHAQLGEQFETSWEIISVWWKLYDALPTNCFRQALRIAAPYLDARSGVRIVDDQHEIKRRLLEHYSSLAAED